MPHMQRAEDYRLATVTGHVIVFKANQPTFVPPEVVSAARAIGAVVINKAEEPALEKPPVTKAELQAAEPIGESRDAQIQKAFDDIVLRNDPAEFTAGGKPKGKVVSQKAGFEVGMLEIANLWTTYSAKMKQV